MAEHLVASHRIRIDLPVDQAHRLFTPAGEERWVDGWRPTYLHPADGRTETGMVFTTGAGDEHTIWSLVDHETAPHRVRYTRVTPASRAGFVEVRCTPAGAQATDVDVSYALTALTATGAESLAAYRGEAFVQMIEGWKSAIDARLPQLRTGTIR